MTLKVIVVAFGLYQGMNGQSEIYLDVLKLKHAVAAAFISGFLIILKMIYH